MSSQNRKKKKKKKAIGRNRKAIVRSLNRCPNKEKNRKPN